DIYSFRVIPKTFTAQGRAVDQVTGEPISNLELFFYDDNNNFFTAITDQDGFYNLPDLSTTVNYYVNAYPEGYVELADTLAVKDQLLANRFEVIGDYIRNFALIPIEVANTDTATETEPEELQEVDAEQETMQEIPQEEIAEIPEEVVPPVEIPETPVETAETSEPETPQEFTLSSDGFPVIYFEFGKANLSDVAIAQLDTVIRFMKSNPEKGIIIHAHTDVISSYLFNFFLSQQRARNIMVHLRRNNVDPERIYTRGHGKTQLAVVSATTEAEHQLNRRATFESIPLEELRAYLENASRHSFRYLNSIEKDAHFAEGVEFMVQFMASNVPIGPQYYKKIMDRIPDVDIIYYYDTDRYHRYLVGSFKDFNDAFAMQRELRQLGYEIYVVAFHDGERIPVSRARRLAAEL
ncbi:MAG: OmpA family protein, partial [Bacteroidota bacterium]